MMEETENIVKETSVRTEAELKEAVVKAIKEVW